MIYIYIYIYIYNRCWKDKYEFLVASKDDDLNKGRYRKGFHNLIQF